MDDVEILNDVKFEIPELVDFKVAKRQVATVIVNGVPQQTQEVECVRIVCPHCDTTINEFDANIPLVEIYKAFANIDESKLIKHCPNCGVRLSYARPVVSEQKGEFVNEESHS